VASLAKWSAPNANVRSLTSLIGFFADQANRRRGQTGGRNLKKCQSISLYGWPGGWVNPVDTAVMVRWKSDILMANTFRRHPVFTVRRRDKERRSP